MALLVFEDVKASPVGDLMEPGQRQKTASELNAAILSSQSQVGGTQKRGGQLQAGFRRHIAWDTAAAAAAEAAAKQQQRRQQHKDSPC